MKPRLGLLLAVSLAGCPSSPVDRFGDQPPCSEMGETGNGEGCPCEAIPVPTDSALACLSPSPSSHAWEVGLEQRLVPPGGSVAQRPEGPPVTAFGSERSELLIRARAFSGLEPFDSDWSSHVWLASGEWVGEVEGRSVYGLFVHEPSGTTFGLAHKYSQDSNNDTWITYSATAPSGEGVWTSSDVLWTSSGLPLPFRLSSGQPVVLNEGHLVALGDGTIVASPALSTANSAVVGDLDLDGQAEIVHRGGVYDPAFNVLWQVDAELDAGFSHVLLQLDDDAEGEVFAIGQREFRIFEHDGTLRESIPWGDDALPWSDFWWPGLPCAADFDGDGAVDVAFGTLGQQPDLRAYRTDGTLLWAVDADDGERAACAGFDLDGDGAYELLHQGETRFAILDGRTGQPLFEHPIDAFGSWTYPTVSDIDEDGSVEILVASQGDEDTRGIYVFGNQHDLWMPGVRRDWPHHYWTGSEQLEDGSLPPGPPTPWLDWNLLRAMPPGDKPMPNLVPEVSACASGCGAVNEVRLEVAVHNAGTAPAIGVVPLVVRHVDGVVIDERTIDLALGSGESTDPVPLVLSGDVLTGAGIEVTVDGSNADAGAVFECVEDDNTVTWGAGLCP